MREASHQRNELAHRRHTPQKTSKTRQSLWQSSLKSSSKQLKGESNDESHRQVKDDYWNCLCWWEIRFCQICLFLNKSLSSFDIFAKLHSFANNGRRLWRVSKHAWRRKCERVSVTSVWRHFHCSLRWCCLWTISNCRFTRSRSKFDVICRLLYAKKSKSFLQKSQKWKISKFYRRFIFIIQFIAHHTSSLG